MTIRDQSILVISALAAPITSLPRLRQWQDPQLLLDTPVYVRGLGKFTLRHHTDDLWHVFPGRERGVLQTIRDHLKSGDVFVDAGANIGIYTVAASGLVGDTGCVIAVEMIPETARILKKHISMNQLINVIVIEKALSDVAEMEVIARVPTGKYGQASIAHGISEGGNEVRVTTTTLADIIGAKGSIALMKMDLEGAEALALAGAGDALSRVRAVIFEDWGDKRLTEIFHLKNFSVERLDGNNCLAVNLTPA